MKIAAIHQPQYVPYLGFFHKLAHADVLVVLDTVQFQKNGLQNRNKIKSAKGWQWLTVPVSHGHDSKILDVQIGDHGKFARKHWSTLQSNYGRAPHFAWAAERLRPVLEATWTHLSPLNIQLARVACELLEIKAPHVLASDLPSEGESSALLISLCKAVGADAYLSGPGGRGYMDLDLFERAGIQVLWQEFVPPTYPQVFPEAGFVPNLSILDILFNCGEAARGFLAR
jgi:hypothetical protein